MDKAKLSKIFEELKDYKDDTPKTYIGDFHSANALSIYGEEFDKLVREYEATGNKEAYHKFKNEMRAIAKTVGLALLYGGTEYTVSQKVGISKEEANEIINRFYSNLSRLKVLHKFQKERVKTEGYTDNIFGSKRYLPMATRKITPEEKADPKLRKKYWSLKSQAERLAMNFPIQSASAIQLILIITAINKWIEKNRLNRMFGDLKHTYKPYTRIIGLSKDKFDKIDKEQLEKELDALPDGSHKFIVYDGEQVILELDRLVSFPVDFIEKWNLEKIF